MSTTDQFLPALDAYQEIQAELRQAGQPLPVYSWKLPLLRPP